MTTTNTSVLVVGGGPAGVTAALQASELGARVTLLEAAQVGGTSLNSGPAPVRTLARAARLARDWSSWAAFGLTGAAPVPDLPAVLANSERVARYAQARLPIPGADLALTYEDIPSLASLPGRVAVIGGADTGCQIASIFADLGAAVTLFEGGPILVPAADEDVSAELGRAFRSRGMTVATGTLVTGLRQAEESIRIDHRCGQTPGWTLADAVFFAVGWPASIGKLNLEAAGIHAEPAAIAVDGYLRTNVGHIFAVGDVNGHLMLVQIARHEGRIAARNAVLGPAAQAAYDVVPSGSFTDPEYGRVGLTETQAAQHHDAVTGVARYDDLLRPVADGRPDGFCKLIADRHTQALSLPGRATRSSGACWPGVRSRTHRWAGRGPGWPRRARRSCRGGGSRDRRRSRAPGRCDA
jgi:pyruvate/2-oxoglutarate dehydrogenase complex dihydrolipoamide dehydrogenase (E3) component